MLGHDPNHWEDDRHRILEGGDEGDVKDGAGIDDTVDEGGVIGACAVARQTGKSIGAWI